MYPQAASSCVKVWGGKYHQSLWHQAANHILVFTANIKRCSTEGIKPISYFCYLTWLLLCCSATYTEFYALGILFRTQKKLYFGRRLEGNCPPGFPRISQELQSVFCKTCPDLTGTYWMIRGLKLTDALWSLFFFSFFLLPESWLNLNGIWIQFLEALVLLSNELLK